MKRDQIGPALNLQQLRKPDRLLMFEELGIDARRTHRKPLLVRAIQAVGADERELLEIWELIEEKKAKAEREAQERESERDAEDRKAEREAEERKAEREAQERKAEREAELELKRVELEIKRLLIEKKAGKRVSDAGVVKPFQIKDHMQPFKVCGDVGLFRVNFEKTCGRIGRSRDTWPQLLLTPLPCEASQVVARLRAKEAVGYDAVKLALEKKYRLSTEAFRPRFRNAKKKPEESNIEYSYDLRSNILEWLKSAEVYGDHDAIVESFGL